MNGNDRTGLPEEIRRSLEEEPAQRQRQMERVWLLMGGLRAASRPSPSTDEAWAELVAVTGRPGPSRRSAHRAADRSARRSRRMFPAVAAAAALAMLLGLWWTLTPATVSTSAGAQQRIDLPDGSVVELNSETTIRYNRLFGAFGIRGERRVTLEGEAYFRVVSDQDPFVVETKNAFVRVLGTEFNVRSRSGDASEGTSVTLASGRVRIAANEDSSQAVTLSNSGDAARVVTGIGIVRAEPDGLVPLERVLAWRNRGFAVVDRPLEAVLDEVERRYAVEIAPREGVSLNEPMSLFYLKGAVPEQILRDICLVQECSFRRTSRGYALSERDASTGAANDAANDQAAWVSYSAD